MEAAPPRLSPSALASSLARHQGLQFERRNRDALAQAVRDFHATISVHSSVDGIDLIRQGAHIVRLAHQPNFLPYENVLLQLRYLHHLTRELKARGVATVGVVLLVDHDIGSTSRFGSSIALNTREPEKAQRFTFPINWPHRLIADQKLPDPAHFCDVASEIERLSHYLCRDETVCARSYDPILAEIVPPEATWVSTAQLSAFAWNTVARHYDFAPDVLFVPLSALSSHLRPVYLELSRALGPDNRGFEQFWTICNECGGRQRMRRVAGGYVSECQHCRATGPSSDPYRDMSVRVVPRVVVDTLSDYVGLDVIGGTMYQAGWPHVMQAHAAAKRLGIPVASEAAWRVNVLHTGVAGKAAYRSMGSKYPSRDVREILTTGRMSLAHYLAFPSELRHLRNAFDQRLLRHELPSELSTAESDSSALRNWLHSISM